MIVYRCDVTYVRPAQVAILILWGQIYIVVDGQILKNYLDISGHTVVVNLKQKRFY